MNFLRHHIRSPAAQLVIPFDLLECFFHDSQATKETSIKSKCLLLPSTASLFKWKNLYFCQQNLLPFMLRILNYGYTNHRQHGKNWRKVSALLTFSSKLNFPFRKTRNETSLGILRVKPEVFDFFSRIFIYIIQRKFFPPSPHHPSMTIK